MFEALLKNQVKGVMQILGQANGLAPFVTYLAADNASTQYDPATGTITEVNVTYENVPAVLASYDSEEIDGNKIAVNDQKAIIASLDLPIEPKLQDKIITADSRTYSIENVGGVPGNSVWILQLRETDGG